MTYAIAIALALTLSSAPIGNIVCASWCDGRFSSSGSDSAVCHGPVAHHHLFSVGAGTDGCEAFASALFIREDTRRVDAATGISIDVAHLSAFLIEPDRRVDASVSTETQRPSANHGEISVLRV